MHICASVTESCISRYIGIPVPSCWGQGMFVARTIARLQLKRTLEWYTWVIAHAFNSISCSLWYPQVAIRNVPFLWKKDHSEWILHSEGSSGLLNVKLACITYITIMKIMFARPAEHHWAQSDVLFRSQVLFPLLSLHYFSARTWFFFELCRINSPSVFV